MSPAMHNAAFDELGLNYAYLAFCVSDVEGAIRGARALNIRGLSVTVPHKVAVMPFLDTIDPVAQQIGAVNTVVNANGHLTGYNTDWIGFTRSLEARTAIQGKQCTILGAGGAARAIAFGLKEKGAPITILNRAEEIAMAERLAGEIGCPWDDLSRMDAVEQADIVINTTPVGMHPTFEDLTPIDTQRLHAGQVVFDAVYNPLETRFLRQAQERGCTTVPGSEMLLLQGVAQFEFWTGRDAPVELMRTVLVNHLTGKM